VLIAIPTGIKIPPGSRHAGRRHPMTTMLFAGLYRLVTTVGLSGRRYDVPIDRR
jgi:hypothetical protein